MNFDIIDLGFCDYKTALDQQGSFHKKISKDNHSNVLIFVEHEPVYTLGKNADDSNILPTHPDDVTIYNIDRGGDVTYHGPGQLVGYPIFDIKKMNMSIGRYVHIIEDILIDTLKDFGIESANREKLIGVWVGYEKIASIGVRVIDGITKHGFALNINTDLSYFNGIVPCGIEDCKVTSMEQLLSKKVDLRDVQAIIVEKFKKYFN
jgi:lipoyl(octanoyl) transferase